MSEQENPLPFSLRDEETFCFIPDDLRTNVLQVLSDTPSPQRAAAWAELYERTQREDPYLVASSVYDFLWKKMPLEKRRILYPVVGDFFLTALEETLGQIGPNNMSSRYRELLECYSGAGDIRRMLEGPIYCADLFLLKVTQLLIGSNDAPAIPESAPQPQTPGHSPDFLDEEKLSTEEQIAHSLELAKDALTDAQRTLLRVNRENLNLSDSYVLYIRATMDRLTLSWQAWKELHSRKDITRLPVEEYFKKGIGLAEKVNSLVLAAMLLEQAGEVYQDIMCREFLEHRFSAKAKDHPRRGCTFDAGEIYRDQGIVERESGAYTLSERRFTRAIALFSELHDRTSVAQTLIERARLYTLLPSDTWRARSDLQLAARNIASVQLRVPSNGPLPKLTPAQVIHFYEHKGLNREAEVCRAQMAGAPE